MNEFYSSALNLDYLLFERAKLEPLLLEKMEIPKAKKNYINPENEKQFMRLLYSSTCINKEELICRYISFKIYHFLRLLHDIELEVFTLYFGKNLTGDLILKDAKIYDLNLKSVPQHLLLDFEPEMGKNSEIDPQSI